MISFTSFFVVVHLDPKAEKLLQLINLDTQNTMVATVRGQKKNRTNNKLVTQYHLHIIFLHQC